MKQETSATLMLDALNIPYKHHIYQYDASAEKLGVAAATALNRSPDHVLKTLMVKVDQCPICAVIPADKELDFSKIVRIFNGKKAKLISRQDAQDITGYQIGGISPFGQKRKVTVVFEESSMDGSPLIINGGKQGLLVEISPQDALLATDGIIGNLIKT